MAPNILIFMVDQLTGTLFADGPAPFLQVPNLRALAARSLRFGQAYSPSPLCAPARASVMAGQYPSRTRVYDNAAEFAASIPTFAHHLRRAGYQTCLSGKMHFVGPDQLHGFEERLTTDVYPADFGWTPDYRKPGERVDWWYHNMGSVTGAGVAEITNQLEYDDEVAHRAGQKLYDLSRGSDGRPWCLTVSFTHPHDPFVARRKYWDLYEGIAELEPACPEPATDAHSARLLQAAEAARFDIRPEHVRRARQGYFANISYVDAKIGEVMEVLARTRQEATILFLSDHGEMLGERGLWFKMSFREDSARVPMMVAGHGEGLVSTPVSTIDMAPTLAEIAGIDPAEVAPFFDGQSLLETARTGSRKAVGIEYAAEASVAPMVALVDGRWKYTACAADPEELYDLEADPWEQVNLASREPARLAAFRAEAARRWDLGRFDAEVRESQQRRLAIYPALRNGGYFPWDWQPLQRASEAFMRNHMDLNLLEETKRFPRGE